MDNNLFIAFVSFFGVYFGANCFNIAGHQFERDGSWENLILTSGEQRITSARNAIECVVICAGVEGCMSFFYVESQQECKLYDYILCSKTGAVSTLGAHYYHRVYTNAEYRTVTLSDSTVFTYRIENKAVNQPKALCKCANANGRLVQVLIMPKVQFLRSLLNSGVKSFIFEQNYEKTNIVDSAKNIDPDQNYTASGFWIDGTNAGATDFNNMAQWVTSTGVGLPTTTDFWHPGHPNNAHTDHCVVMYKTFNNFWTDRTCSSRRPYICERL